MKTNIRLFVPNTTETLIFEYGLLIHYMTYNDAKARSEISLDYYELSKIDPISNALDIVEQKQITDTTRQQSKLNGFTLSNHYTFSFDERYNNRIPAQNVRQVWLWLHCDEDQDYSFVVEKFTDTEQKIVSKNNQLFSRLWAHDDWIDRNSDPLSQQVVAGRTGLVTLLTQQLAVQFEQIEQENRKKALAAIQAANPQPEPVSPPVAATPVSPPPSPVPVVPVIVSAPSTALATPAPVSAPIVPPPVPVRTPAVVPINDREYQPISPSSPKKNKTWIWVVAGVIGLPMLVILVQSGQKEQAQDRAAQAQDRAAQAQDRAAQAATPAQDSAVATAETTEAVDAAILETDATSEVLADRPVIRLGMQFHYKTKDYRDPRGSLDDVSYQIIGDQDGVVSIDKTITARPDSKVTLLYDESMNLIGGKTGRYIPALANYDFPLVEGKTWDVTSEVIGNQYKDLQHSVGQVLGQETIATPMGEIKTIKVLVTHTTYLAGVEVSKGQDISWYAPVIGRSVKTEETYWDAETQSWVVGRLHEMTHIMLP